MPHLVGRTIVEATLLRRDMLVAPGDPVGGFSRQRGGAGRARPARIEPADLLQGATVSDIARRGKQLAIICGGGGSDGRAMGVQLGMTGHVEILRTRHREPLVHVHARWRLSGGGELVFHDPRRFGSLRVFRTLADLAAHWNMLGPDALTITVEELHRGLADTDRSIKAALLDQAVLAGVGNIYADESLFVAHIHPRRPARLLRAEEVARLADAIRQILSQAVEAGGSTLRDYADANGEPGAYQAQHLVYGRGGEACRQCSGRLAAGLLAQRTTVWCPSCQPARPRRGEAPKVAKVRGALSTGHPRSGFGVVMSA